MHRKIQAIVKYILFNFKNVVNEDFKNFIIFIFAELIIINFKRKNLRLIKNNQEIVLFEKNYIINLNIISILILIFKIIISSREFLMNSFNILIFKLCIFEFLYNVLIFFNFKKRTVNVIIK